jgi:response regulator of citrate/malate metabolism
VIAVTSARDLAVVREGVSLGVVQYVLKPFAFATLRDRLVRYAEFRASVGEASGQEEVDRALAALRAPQAAALPKGMSGPTLTAVTEALRGAADGLTASEAAAAVGISRITARRYLEHLVSTGLAGRSPRYGNVGRPELCFRWLTQRR